MSHRVSRRVFVEKSGALAASVVAGASTLARTEQLPTGRSETQLTAGMIDFHVHTSPDTAERTVSVYRIEY